MLLSSPGDLVTRAIEKNLLSLYLAMPDKDASGLSGFFDRFRKEDDDDAEK